MTIDTVIRWRQRDLLPNLWVASHGTLVLKSFATWLALKGHHRDANNGRSVLLGLEVTRPVAKARIPFTDEQLGAIWAALAERDNRERLRGIAYAHLLYATGLRRTDAGLILRKNLNTSTRWLNVAITQRGRTVVKKMRLSRVCVEAVQNYLNGPERPPYLGPKPEPLFINEDGYGFKLDGFGSWVNRIGDDIEELTGIPWTPTVMKLTSEVHARSGIADAVLRRRVASLLEDDSDHDRAIELATTILEARVRERSGAGDLDGDELMKWAFLPDKQTGRARLQLAAKVQEQGGAFNVYRGVADLYRNGTHHDVRADDFDSGEARRVVSWIDHLLGLID